MARTNFGFQIGSALATNYLTDSKFIRAGYIAVDTIAERDALPIDTGSGGVIANGSLCYVTADKKFYKYNGTAWEEAKFGSDITISGTAVTDGTNTFTDNVQDVKVGSTSVLDTTTHTATVALDDSLTYDTTNKKLKVTNPVTANPTGTYTNELSKVTIGSTSYNIKDTTYSSKEASQGGTDVSLVTTGEKYTWNNKTTVAANPTDATTNELSKIKIGDTAYNIKDTTYQSKAAASGGTDVSLVTTGEKYTWDNKQDVLTQGNGILITKDTSKGTTTISAKITDNVTSTSTTDALSANMGKSLQDQITNLQGVGRFLALWDCTTGKPLTDPTTDPYTYKTGDYYRVSKVAEEGGKNYKPNGTTYTKDQVSTTEETGEISVGCTYFFDGASWSLQKDVSGSKVQDVQINGSTLITTGEGIANIPIASSTTLGVVKPVAKTTTMTQSVGVDSDGLLYTDISSKQDKLTEGTGITIEKDSEGNTVISSTAVGGVTDVKIGTSSIVTGTIATIPTASKDTLGVVKPVTKTDAMTVSVGVDSDGALYTTPTDISGKQDSDTAVTHTKDTAVGNSTTPVYIASNGVATSTGIDLNDKQDKLYGDDKTTGKTQNIKTINNQNILGTGNITVNGLPSGGSDGNIILKDSTATIGAKWVDAGVFYPGDGSDIKTGLLDADTLEGHNSSYFQTALTVNPETTSNTLTGLTINGTSYSIKSSGGGDGIVKDVKVDNISVLDQVTGIANIDLTNKQDAITVNPTTTSAILTGLTINNINYSIPSSSLNTALIIGDGKTSQFTINHSLNTRDLITQVYDLSDYSNVLVDVYRTTNDTILIDFKEAPTEGREFKLVMTAITSSQAVAGSITYEEI